MEQEYVQHSEQRQHCAAQYRAETFFFLVSLGKSVDVVRDPETFLPHQLDIMPNFPIKSKMSERTSYCVSKYVIHFYEAKK